MSEEYMCRHGIVERLHFFWKINTFFGGLGYISFFLSWEAKPQLNHWTKRVENANYSFFLSWEANTQLNHWTKPVVNTQLILKTQYH
jgi:hypothetical protein